MRIPDRDLPHRVTLEARKSMPSSSGTQYQAPREGVLALVVSKASEVVDERPDSDTRGSIITAHTSVRMHLEDYVPPGSRITVFAGTPAEHVGTVVNAHYNQHSIAPESALAYLV